MEERCKLQPPNVYFSWQCVALKYVFVGYTTQINFISGGSAESLLLDV